MYTSFSEIWEGWTKNLFAGMRYSWQNVIGAVLLTFCFNCLGFVILCLWPLGLVSTAVGIWGLVLTLLCQAMRLLMDIRRKQNSFYGLSHAPANLIVCFLILNSAIRSQGGGVVWKGRTYKPEGN